MDVSQPAPSLRNRLSGVFRRWSFGKKAKTQVEVWQELDATGASLEALMSQPGWALVEKVRGYYQRKAEVTMRVPELSDSQRLRAAIEWNLLDKFFRDLNERVYQGQKARESLQKVQVKTP